MNKQNKVIESQVNLSLESTLKRANAYLKVSPEFKDGYVYVDCPNISDLFVIEKGKLRQCETSEWSYYYKIYLYPPKPATKVPAFHEKSLMSW